MSIQLTGFAEKLSSAPIGGRVSQRRRSWPVSNVHMFVTADALDDSSWLLAAPYKWAMN